MMLLKYFLTNLTLFSMSVPAIAWDVDASCPAPPENATKAQMSAGQLFEDAEKAYKQGRAVDALKGFLCSFRIIPHENTLFNIAQIAKLSEGQDEVLGLLKNYVANVTGSAKVDPIREIVAELEKSAESAPASGEPAVEAPPPPAVEPEPAEPTPMEPIVAEPKGNGLKAAGWAIFGVGAAAAVAGGVLQGLAGSAQADAEASDTYPEFTDARNRMKALQIGGIAGLATGGTLLAAGLVIAVVSNRREEAAPVVAVTPGLGSLSLWGSF